MTRFWFGVLLCVVGLVAGPVVGQMPAASGTIAVGELRAGMKGHGESVFSGSESERFEVEVLGVLNDLDPGTSYILGRLTGQGLEKSGVVAGMSGSPVWIGDRLVGAVAFAWPFSQEAIAGITPIASMREQHGGGLTALAAGQAATSLPGILGHAFASDLWRSGLERLSTSAAVNGRSALLWTASGFPAAVFDTLHGALPALAPASAGRTTREPDQVRGGSSVAAVLIDGDFRFAATGTITEREGDTVLAFGHSIAELGPVSVPMASAEVVTVLGSSYSSFKLSNSGPVVGEFTFDHKTGVAGRLGVVPRTLPLEIEVRGSSSRSFSLRIARVPDLLAALTGVGAMAALGAATPIGSVHGVDLDLEVDLGAAGVVALRQSFDGAGSAGRAASFVVAVVDYLSRSDLARLELERVELRLEPRDTPRTAEIVDAHALASRLRAGDGSELVVAIRDYRGEVVQHRVAFEVPAEIAPGRYVLLAGDGPSLDAVRLTLEPPAPRSFAQAKRLIESLSSSRELVVLGLAPGFGAVAGGDALPRLPPSVSAIWAGAARTERPIRMAILRRQKLDWPVPLAGVARVDVEVVAREPAPTRRPNRPSNGRKRNGVNE